jgi:hypothetical protein
MAITNIDCTQDNHSGASNLIALHNPVIFILTVTYTGTPPPDDLYVLIKDILSNTLGNYRCVPYDDVDLVTRRFIFIADEILRSFMQTFEDEIQTDTTIELRDELTKYFTLDFYDPDPLGSASVETVVCVGQVASRQFGQDCNNLEYYQNSAKHYVGIEGYPCYFYCFVDFPLTNVLNVYVDGSLINSLIASDSYSVYRFAYSSIAKGSHTVEFRILTDSYGLHTVDIKEDCNYRVLKYLDKNGEFRFYPFNKYYTENAMPQLLGKTNELITSLLTSQGNENIVGYKNSHRIHLIADGVSQTELDNLKDIWTSPKVYLYIGNTDNQLQDWIKVEIQSSDNPVKWGKNNFNTVELDCILPENFNINML